MPWKDVTIVDQRQEFVALAGQGTASMAELCRRFGISRKTGYKWLNRYRVQGDAGLVARSRRPQTSPGATPAAMLERIRIVAVANPTWGGRLIRHRLLALGLDAVPAASTITAILTRDGVRSPAAAAPRPIVRFEADAPNHRFQMDFKGWVPSRTGRIVPFTVLDEYSRYVLLLEHTADGTLAAIQALLTDCFRRYGLPWQLLADNGPPWGSSRPKTLTAMDVWLLRLGVRPLHGRPGHPQTQGKLERFHRTLNRDVFQLQTFDSPAEAQRTLDAFRQCYNHERPHAALGYQVPATKYALSPRPFPEVLPPIEYDEEAVVRIVSRKGAIKYDRRALYLSEALGGLPVGLYPTRVDGVIQVKFCARTITTVDLRTLEAETAGVTHVSEQV